MFFFSLKLSPPTSALQLQQIHRRREGQKIPVLIIKWNMFDTYRFVYTPLSDFFALFFHHPWQSRGCQLLSFVRGLDGVTLSSPNMLRTLNSTCLGVQHLHHSAKACEFTSTYNFLIFVQTAVSSHSPLPFQPLDITYMLLEFAYKIVPLKGSCLRALVLATGASWGSSGNFESRGLAEGSRSLGACPQGYLAPGHLLPHPLLPANYKVSSLFCHLVPLP